MTKLQKLIRSLKDLLNDSPKNTLMFLAMLLLFFYFIYDLNSSKTKTKEISTVNHTQQKKKETSLDKERPSKNEETAKPANSLNTDVFSSTTLKEQNYYKKKDALCLNTSSRIFLLPRQIAREIIKTKNTTFYLPAEYSECLSAGLIRFWVIDFDPISQFPFRYYLEIETSISSIENLDYNSMNKPEVDKKISELKKIFPEILYKSITRVRINNPIIKNEQFTINNNTLLFANKIDTAPDLLSQNTVVTAEALKNFSYLSNVLVAPSNSMLRQLMASWPEEKKIFIAENSKDLGVLNLEVAYFFKFKKRAYVYYKKNSLKKEKPYFKTIAKQKLFPLKKNNILIDLRPLKNSKHFNFTNQIKINADLRGAGYFGDVLNRLTTNDQVIKNTKELFKNKISENIDLFKYKFLILIGQTTDDPLVDLFLETLPEEIRQHTLVFNEGYYFLIQRSYFYGENFFVNDPKFQFDNDQIIKNFLYFSF